MGFSPLGRLTVKVVRNKGLPTSPFQGFSQGGESGSRRSLKDRWERSSSCTYTPPVTSTQTNPASVFRNSPMLKSGLQTRIPALRDASWYQAAFSDHLCCSLMSNTSALLSCAVCIRRFWASFPLSCLSFRNFTIHRSTSRAPP